jgi:hypothetical protein
MADLIPETVEDLEEGQAVVQIMKPGHKVYDIFGLQEYSDYPPAGAIVPMDANTERYIAAGIFRVMPDEQADEHLARMNEAIARAEQKEKARQEAIAARTKAKKAKPEPTVPTPPPADSTPPAKK